MILIVYEYPFNERLRTFLRLEELYEKFLFFSGQMHCESHQAALLKIFEMLEVAGRIDLKSDLLQEIERQKQMLTGFQSNPEVETERLWAILTELERISANLLILPSKTGQSIRENEWLMAIRSRASIAGGTSSFDLPAYFAWQHLAQEQRAADIAHWFAPMQPLFDALKIVLHLLRESGQTLKIIAENGNYQQMLQGKMYQMLRLAIDPALGVIPEISANKYMLWIRFLAQSQMLKPTFCDRDVSFDLTLCSS